MHLCAEYLTSTAARVILEPAAQECGTEGDNPGVNVNRKLALGSLPKALDGARAADMLQQLIDMKLDALDDSIRSGFQIIR